MDRDDEDGRAPSERGFAREGSREPRTDPRRGRQGLEERLEGWVSRGRDLVDGVSGARPGTRPPGRAGRGGFDGLGRWVEGRLDWLLDDRDDWRESWQEAPASSPEGWEPAPPTPRRSRPPLEAVSRRRASVPSPSPPRPEAPLPAEDAPQRDWPEEDAFSVPRWRREDPSPPRPANPLAESPAVPAPGRPLPRSTRRR